MTGFWSSTTVTVKLAVSTFPWLSVAVTVTGVIPTANTLPLAGLATTVSTAQLSVALNRKVTLLEQTPLAATTLIFPGIVITGFWSSTTVTVKLAVSTFPWLSVAVTVTGVIPTANTLPLAGLATTVSTAQLSVALNRKVTLLEQTPLAATTLIFPGIVITGFWSSTTVTVKLAVSTFPWLSVAVTVTGVIPTANTLPLAGLATTVSTAQLSVALNRKVTLLEQTPLAATALIFPGIVMTGFWSSTTVTVKLAVSTFPWLSVAVTVTGVIPTANTLPLAGLATTVSTAQLSVALNRKVTLLEQTPLAATTLISVSYTHLRA